MSIMIRCFAMTISHSAELRPVMGSHKVVT